MNYQKILAAGLAATLLLSGCGAEKTTKAETTPVSTTAVQETTVPMETTFPQETQARIALEDGVYTAEFVTDSSMFRANETCDGKGTLTVENGQAVFHVSLSSKNILNLYLGLAADAEGDPENWLQPTTDTVTYSDGLSEEVNGFDIPVSVIGEDFDLALIGKKGKWYDHKVSVCNPVPQEAETVIPEDGTYTCEVSLSGGSGRAKVESPAKLTVKDGVILATIVWSSPNYEYMLVGEQRYEPIQTEGNAVFAIPVTLDVDNAVSASTIAMSQPHLVDYVLHFDSSTLQGAEA